MKTKELKSKKIDSFSYEELSKDIELTEDPTEYGHRVLISLFNKVKKVYEKDNNYEDMVDVDPRKMIMEEEELINLIESICDEYEDQTATIGIRLAWMNSGPSGREVEGVEKGKILLRKGYMVPAEKE